MPESKNNAWLHGPARFKAAEFPNGINPLNGLFPMPAIFNLEVGEEIVFYLKDSTPFISTLAKVHTFNLGIHSGVARNKFGCLGFFVFWIPSPFNQNVPLAIYDLYLNPQSEAQLGLWRELAHQTHWHMFLLDRKNEQRNFFEIVNTFRIQEALDEMQQYWQGISILDFDKAKAQFMMEKSVEEMFQDGFTASPTTDGGLSVYDESFAIPHAPDSANPLKAARYVRIVRESVARHSGDDKLTAATYLDGKLHTLQSQVAQKKIVYLDVCHWINLRHVWLQSAQARPIYEQVLACLTRLTKREAVLCPLSMPIFEELMKQDDPRSRAATANLMDIFSQGVSLMSFEDSFAVQCLTALSAEADGGPVDRNSISKIGFWFGEEQARTAWWSPDLEEVWDHVSIDLRWAMTVCDCQKFTARGFVHHQDRKHLFEKWTELPGQQKTSPKPFWELSKACRSDVVADYVAQILSRVEAILGERQPEEVRASVLNIAQAMVDSRDYGRIPCCEVVAGMCAARVFGGGKIRSNDIFDFLHASVGIPSSDAYFCDGPMEHLVRSKVLRLDEHFGVKVHSKPEDLLNYLNAL